MVKVAWTKIASEACLTAVVVLQLVPRAEPLTISIANGFGLQGTED